MYAIMYLRVSYVSMCCVFEFLLAFCDRFFCFKQKTAYEMRISDWSSDVCSSDLQRSREVDAGLMEPTQPTAKACQESRPAAIRTVRDRSHGAARPRTSADGCARRDARVRQAVRPPGLRQRGAAAGAPSRDRP